MNLLLYLCLGQLFAGCLSPLLSERHYRISSVVVMSSSGVLVCDFTTGTMNGDKFYTFVCACAPYSVYARIPSS